MVRKNIGSRKSLSKSEFDVDFEVVLIVVLIVVAILLICFINKKFKSENFLASKVREHLRSERHGHGHAHVHGNGHEHFTEHSNSKPNSNGNSERHLYLFYATWCGFSRKFLEEELPELERVLEENGVRDRFHSMDVETETGREHANLAGVTGLPSVYVLENDVYTKVDDNNNHEENVSRIL